MSRPDTAGRNALALVVDDDPTIRLMLESTLAKAGMRTLTVADGRSALAAFASVAPDLVLLDIGLPDIDGYEACSAMRAMPHGRDTPLLMLTGREDATSVERSYEVGATDFIAKPINWEILVHRVRYILRSARAFTEVATSRARLADAQRVAGLGSWEWDIALDDLQCSDEARRILGVEADAGSLSSEVFFAPLPQRERAWLKDKLVETARTGTPTSVEQSIVRMDGERRLLHVFAAARRQDSGHAAVVHGTVQDVTERRAAEARIRYLAYHDSLTGLPNRAWLQDELERSLASAARSGGVLAVMLLDLDQFKRINDTLGHSIGDRLLCAVAERLKERLRREDTLVRASDGAPIALSRLGGDEFCIVLNELDQPSSAAKVAARVLDAFIEPFVLGDHEAVVSPSIGIAIYPHDAADTDGILKAADTAMYETKNEGRNNFSFYSASMNARALERLTIESELRHAIEREEMVLLYQPIVAIETGAIVGLEALLRWHHPEMGLLMPSRFIEIAEESGLIVPLGEWVLRAACSQSSCWLAEGLPAPLVAVNVSGEQFRRASLVQTVQGVLDQTGLDAARLKLEITESVLMRDAEVTLRSLARIREIGVHLSIDDFGTGYSSLSYLKRFPVDELKLDRSFVREIIDGPRNAAIATAVIEMARGLSLSLVAEGVERAPQVDLLRRLRCPHGQGYYFSRPQPAAAIAGLLRAGRPLLSHSSAGEGALADAAQT
jgi:diguanylate cyclase (GGDEF)-like protein/PAS domain S-box-containing protein